MVTGPPDVLGVLDRADAARAAGRAAEAAPLYDEVVARCRASGDLDGWTRAVLGAASVHVFGAEPGRLPAELHDVLARTIDTATRARLMAAIARCWAYAAQPARGTRFAHDAVGLAESLNDDELLADCLDAALAVHWGPDELGERAELVARLDEVSAHALSPGARLQAHLWGLQVACETLDVQAIHRQLRALDLLGEESPRARFFAASRRHMLDLMLGRTEATPRLLAIATDAADRAGLADAWMVLESMKAYSAAQAGDIATCAAGASACEQFGLEEGSATVCAEAAFLWVCAGEIDRARVLVNTFHQPALADLPRDVNWLLTLQCVLEAALATGVREVVEDASLLLEPYTERAVINAGAVMFHGVVADTVSRAADVLGDHARARSLRARALATYDRLDARWWRDRLALHDADGGVDGGTLRANLRPAASGLWLVGSDPAPATVPGLRGLGYLRELVRRPRQEIDVLDLVGAGSTVVDERSLGDVLDRRAISAYRQRLTDLEDELAEADDWSDAGRMEAIRNEREAILDELRRVTGLGGRSRTTGGSQERARVAVQKAIRAAIDRVASVDESLGRHLRRSIHTGSRCRYEPDPDDQVDWLAD